MMRGCFGMLLLVGLIGCGESTSGPPLPKTVPAAGTITLDGKPLASATVTFLPKSDPKGTDCRGFTDATGKYTLKQTAKGGKDGAPAGDYKVVVSRFLMGNGQPMKPEGPGPNDGAATESLPVKYSVPASTTLTATVPAAGGTFDFQLTSK